MMKTFFVTILISCASLCFSQEIQKSNFKNIGLNYFGELGFRPGFEIDFGLPLAIRGRVRKKRSISHQVYFRPAFAYYYYDNNSNNFSIAGKLNYQLRLVNSSSDRYIFLEPFIKFGYLRKSYIGEKFRTSPQGFQPVRIAGSNSLTAGAGLDFGGYLSKRTDWLCGMDYFIEGTEDSLILHRFVAKIGTRIKLN